MYKNCLKKNFKIFRDSLLIMMNSNRIKWNMPIVCTIESIGRYNILVL